MALLIYLILATLIILIFRFTSIWRQCIWFVAKRRPCKIVKFDGEDILRRYHLLELPFGMTLVLHQFVQSDPDRGYHDHPWSFGMSLILSGGYYERKISHTTNPIGKPEDQVPINMDYLSTGRINVFSGKDYHRVILPENGEAWTLFLTGPRKKIWGFLNARSQGYCYTAYSTTIHDPDGRWWLDPKYQPKT
jgi:hypothetical protein